MAPGTAPVQLPISANEVLLAPVQAATGGGTWMFATRNPIDVGTSFGSRATLPELLTGRRSIVAAETVNGTNCQVAQVRISDAKTRFIGGLQVGAAAN